MNRGIATLEMLIAMAIMILAIGATSQLSLGSQPGEVSTQTNQEALYKAQSAIETARATARVNFSDPSLAPGTYTTTDVSGITYTKKLTITAPDSFTKNITSLITWSNGQYVTLSTTVTDWQGALGGDTCNPTLAGDWTNPVLLGNADVGQNNGGTDVDAVSGKAYVTADASAANKPDFYIIDTSNPNISNLPILGSVNTGPGLAAVRVSGNYAYVANISTASQLQVIDISVPSTLSVVASLDVTTPSDPAVGNSIFYLNKKVYLGLTKSSGSEFYVIDVSNPLSPSVKASFEINSQVDTIRVRNGIAYLAVPDDTSTASVSEQLKILDVSNADIGTITLVNTFSPNPSTMSGYGLYVSKDSKTLYLGEGGANPSNKPELFSIDVTNPHSLSQIDSKYIPTSNNITVNAIVVRNNLAFIWTNDTNLGFQIWDLNNLTSPTPYASLNTQQTATGGMDCDGNYIYTAQKSNKALQIIGPS